MNDQYQSQPTELEKTLDRALSQAPEFFASIGVLVGFGFLLWAAMKLNQFIWGLF